MSSSDLWSIEAGRAELKIIEKQAEMMAVESPESFRVEPRIIDVLISVGVRKEEIEEVVFHDKFGTPSPVLTREESDRAVRLARIVQLAERVFANHQKAFLWLRAPNERLAKHTPISRLETEAGARVVEELLTRIDYGLAA